LTIHTDAIVCPEYIKSYRKLVTVWFTDSGGLFLLPMSTVDKFLYLFNYVVLTVSMPAVCKLKSQIDWWSPSYFTSEFV